MTTINETLLCLLDEIDDLCNKNSLSYFLSGRALRQAYNSGHLSSNINVIEILMPLDDIFVLGKCISDIPGRTLESIFTNQKFKFFFFKYVADDTTYYNRTLDSTSNACGIHVRIRPLKQDSNTNDSKYASMMKRFWVRYHRRNPYEWVVSGSFKNQTKLRVVKATIDLRYDSYYKLMLEKICSSQNNYNLKGVNYINCRRYNKGSKNRIYFPEGMFFPFCYVELDGHWYRAVRNIRDFMDTIAKAEGDREGQAIFSTTIPYTDYFEYIHSKGLTTDLSRAMMDEAIAKLAYKRTDKLATLAWRKMQRTVLEKKLTPAINEMRDVVLEYYHNGQWNELGEILCEFDAWSRAYAKRKISLNFDESVMQAYLAWLEHIEKDKLAKKIRIIIERENNTQI